MSTSTELANTPELDDELPALRPPVDVFENDDGYLIRADLPGVNEDDVDIRFDRGELVVEARRPHALDGTRLAHEFGGGTFRRSFRISARIAADKISAKLASGVLELELPKADEVKPRRIAITTS